MKTENLTIAEALKNSNDGQNQDIKGQFVSKHVYCNVGTMVEYILGSVCEDTEAPFTMDDVENMYSYPEYNGKYLHFNGGTEEEKNEIIANWESYVEDGQHLVNNESEEDIREEIVEMEDLESEAQDVYEWWAVSDFLYRKLKDLGHPVLDAGSCLVWGRCTTGQAILLDYSISQICAEMGILEGQGNSWARK